MRHSQKAMVILTLCMIMVAVSSGAALIKAFRPSAGLPYEQLTYDQANKYMEFEEGYILADVNSREQFLAKHLDGAVSVPYETLVENAVTVFPDKQQMIYVYADDNTISGNACRKLCELGYSSITQIIDTKVQMTESET